MIADANYLVSCACGCGSEFMRLDSKYRIRKYVTGHSSQKRPIETRLCACGCGKTFQVKDTCTYRYIRFHQNKIIAQGRTPWNKGKHYKPANIEQFLDGGHKTRFSPDTTAKEKNCNWKGGVTDEQVLLRGVFTRTISPLVFKRDHYTCQLCGQVGDKLHADHIKSWKDFPELRFEVSNCQTLCVKCHYKKTFGKDMPRNSHWGVVRRTQYA